MMHTKIMIFRAPWFSSEFNNQYLKFPTCTLRFALSCFIYQSLNLEALAECSPLEVIRGTEERPHKQPVPDYQSQVCPGTAEVDGRKGRKGDTLPREGRDEGQGAVGSHKKCCSSNVVGA